MFFIINVTCFKKINWKGKFYFQNHRGRIMRATYCHGVHSYVPNTQYVVDREVYMMLVTVRDIAQHESNNTRELRRNKLASASFLLCLLKFVIP